MGAMGTLGALGALGASCIALQTCALLRNLGFSDADKQNESLRYKGPFEGRL